MIEETEKQMLTVECWWCNGTGISPLSVDNIRVECTKCAGRGRRGKEALYDHGYNGSIKGF